MMRSMLRLLQSKYVLLWLLVVSFYLFSLLRYYPILGHDYSMLIATAFDYNYAWKNFSQFNIYFTPQRCLGVPVWANPNGTNFSLFHVLSLYLSEIQAVIAYLILLSLLVFYGIKKFVSLFTLRREWEYFIILGWCLQGFIVTRISVGHLFYVNYGLWPLLFYIILKNTEGKKEFFKNVSIVTLILSHEIYSANSYLFIMFPVSLIISLIIFKLYEINFNLADIFKKMVASYFFIGLIILPKVLAVTSFTRNFQRVVNFEKVGLFESFNYLFNILFLPLKLDFFRMTGWEYGNWECMNYIFPGLLTFLFVVSLIKFKKHKNTIVCGCLLLIAGVIITSGIYADFIKSIPILKMLHVNPRWLAILGPATLITVIKFLEIEAPHKKLSYLFFVSVFAFPIYFLDKDYFIIVYKYGQGLDRKINRLSYCYDPAFGYNLELLPFSKIKGKYADPRCYIGKIKCDDYTLPTTLHNSLENYSLTPHKD